MCSPTRAHNSYCEAPPCMEPGRKWNVMRTFGHPVLFVPIGACSTNPAAPLKLPVPPVMLNSSPVKLGLTHPSRVNPPSLFKIKYWVLKTGGDELYAEATSGGKGKADWPRQVQSPIEPGWAGSTHDGSLPVAQSPEGSVPGGN